LRGNTTNRALLPRSASLESPLLIPITKLSDLTVLGDLVGLEKLHLDGMRNVTSLHSLHASLDSKMSRSIP
jgi:hypothetical protein